MPSTDAEPATQQCDASSTKAQVVGSLVGIALAAELYVKMTCSSCEKSVRAALEALPGTQSVSIDLKNELVRATGTASANQMLAALADIGKEARLISLGAQRTDSDAVDTTAASVVPQPPAEVGSSDENTNCVAEFKGRSYGHGDVVGVVRLVQLGQNDSVFEFDLAGLEPARLHQVTVHKSGDLREGPAGVGDIFPGQSVAPAPPAGLLCESTSDQQGRLSCYGLRERLRVWEIIGRAICVSAVPEGAGAGSSDGAQGERLAAAVVARSAGPGGNYKKVCSCDGTVIYDADATELPSGNTASSGL
jgi:copper chaperone for superoxide dismutase